MSQLRLVQPDGQGGPHLPQHNRKQPPPKQRQRRRKKPYQKSKPLEEWLRELAILDRQWRKEGKYGKPIVEKVQELIDNKPIAMTEVFISPSMYKFKFGTNKRREKTNDNKDIKR